MIRIKLSFYSYPGLVVWVGGCTEDRSDDSGTFLEGHHVSPGFSIFMHVGIFYISLPHLSQFTTPPTISTMKRSSSSTQEEDFVSSVLLKTDINKVVQSFSSPESFLFTGIICKDWISVSKTTSIDYAASDVNMIGEYLSTVDFSTMGVDRMAAFMMRVSEYGDPKCLLEIHGRYEKITGGEFPWDAQCYFRENTSCDFYEEFTFRNIIGPVAKRGDFETVKWLYGSGCNFSTESGFSSRVYHWKPESKKYDLMDLCPRLSDDSSILLYILGKKDLFMTTKPIAIHSDEDKYKMIMWLLDNKCPVKGAIQDYGRHFKISKENFAEMALFKGNGIELFTVLIDAVSFSRKAAHKDQLKLQESPG